MAIIPYPYCEDVGAALDFLADAFGFVVYGPRVTDVERAGQ